MLFWILFLLLERSLKVWNLCYCYCVSLRNYAWQTIHASEFLDFTEQHDVKVSVNDIVIKAVAIALRNVPLANGKICYNCYKYWLHQNTQLHRFIADQIWFL